MRIKIYSKDGTKLINVFTWNVLEIIHSIEHDFELKHIDKIQLDIDIVFKNNIKIRELESNIESVKYTTSASMKILDIKSMYAIFSIKGKLSDVFGVTESLGIPTKFTLLSSYMSNDVEIIKFLIGNDDRRGNRVDIMHSLIIRYLSEKNSNMDYNTVWDILRKDIKKTELRNLLPTLFTEIYGHTIDKSIYTSSNNKLNLNSIDDEVIKDIDINLREIIRGTE